jgi:hypothetical protein
MLALLRLIEVAKLYFPSGEATGPEDADFLHPAIPRPIQQRTAAIRLAERNTIHLISHNSNAQEVGRQVNDLP